MKKVKLRYGSKENQFGELSLPNQDNRKKLPTVISIHGGFWKDSVTLSNLFPVDEQLVDAGLAVWNIEYRRVGQSGGGYPQTFEDVSSAINYLATIAEEYPIDLNKVVVIGHSAGGHLALWAASRYQHAADELGAPIDIKLIGVVSMAGVTDLQAMWLDQQGTDMAETVPNFMGGTPEQVPARYQLTSPIDLLPIGVRTVLVHGDDDNRVPVQLSKSYYKKALESGDNVELIEIPGAGHFDLTNKDAKAWQLTKQAISKIFNEQ